MLEFPVTTWVDLFHLRAKQNKTKHGGGFLSQEEDSPIMGLLRAAPGIMVPVGNQRGPLPGELRGGNRLVITSGGQVREVGEVQRPPGPAEGPCAPPWSALSLRAGAGDPGKVPGE